jgi:hypothetical protein
MTELLDIIVGEPKFEWLECLVMVTATINLHGNTFQAVGACNFEYDSVSEAILKAQDVAVIKAKEFMDMGRYYADTK